MSVREIESDLRQHLVDVARTVPAHRAAALAALDYQPRTRALPQRRTIARLGLAAAAGAALVAGPLLWAGGPGAPARAFAVTTAEDGSVRVETSWSQLHQPADLQAALDAAGARTRIYVTGDAPVAATPACTDYVQQSVDVPPAAVPDTSGSDDGHLNMLVRPNEFPAGTTMIVIVDYLTPDDGNASTATYFATGALPDCAPTEWAGPTGGGSIGH